MMNSILFWFRRDLRLSDNVGLHQARADANRLYTSFVVDPTHQEWKHRCGDRLQFKLDAVRSLSDQINQGGGELLVRRGSAAEELVRLAADLKVDAVYWNRAYEPYERERDHRVEERLRENGVSVETFKDQVLFEKEEITTKKGTPYKVFTPYSKRWKATKTQKPVGAVSEFDSPQRVESNSIPTVEDLGLQRNLTDLEWKPTPKAARERWNQFIRDSIEVYDQHRDQPAQDGTSRLSPHLRFGLISARTLYWEARQAYDDLGRKQGVETYVDELIWRDFYHQILWNFPRVATGNFHEKYDDLEWEWDEAQFEAWKKGHTGYPIVDAAMRQLNQTGWMHNRLRMIVASFLTKDLLIHWKHGEKYFMNRLLDGDTAANNGGWQWASSTGTDAVPYFRIFNPVSQSETHDPAGNFIRRYCPELEDLPDESIHAPFQVDSHILETAGISLGENYPEPIVDHSFARERALERFEQIND